LYFSVHSGKCQDEQFTSRRLELYTGIGDIQTKDTYVSVLLLTDMNLYGKKSLKTLEDDKNIRLFM
jgi:hypothetical protein